MRANINSKKVTKRNIMHDVSTHILFLPVFKNTLKETFTQKCNLLILQKKKTKMLFFFSFYNSNLFILKQNSRL